MLRVSVLLRALLPAVLVLAALAPPAAALVPGDPLFSEQWALQSGAPLDGPAAWALAGTGAQTTVAVLDTGIDAGHPDLRGALWTNPGEIAGNRIDDDRNGWVDDVHGFDFVRGDGDPDDEEGHGTHVAGLIAAAQDDTGITGLAPGARIMAIKVLDAQRNGSTSAVADGIRYALAHGADAINVSVNGDVAGRSLTEAVAAADAAGVPVVASAGNDGRDLDVRPSYPAAFDMPTVLAVAGGTSAGLLASFSNFGARTVDLAAPAEEILSTARGGGYETRSGTSMAAPWAAATLALLHGARADLSGAQLVATLRASARRSGGLSGLLQAGQLDPVAAIRAVLPADRLAAADAAAAAANASAVAPTLTGRVARRGKRPSRRGSPASRLRRVLVTWRTAQPIPGLKAFRVTAGGRTLAARGARARGAWLRTRARRVRITALDADQRTLASTVVRLR
jgi:subtilisin family serine protease